MSYKQATYQDIASWAPCRNHGEYWASDYSGTLFDKLDHPSVPTADKIWLVVRDHFFTKASQKKLMFEFFDACVLDDEIRHAAEDYRTQEWSQDKKNAKIQELYKMNADGHFQNFRQALLLFTQEHEIAAYDFFAQAIGWDADARTTAKPEMVQPLFDKIRAEYMLNGIRAEVAQTVTPRQMRLALIKSGVSMDTVDGFINNLPQPLQDTVRVTWEYSVEFQRTNPVLNQMAPMLQLKQSDLDNLFNLAATL